MFSMVKIRVPAIRQVPDPILREISAEVAAVDIPNLTPIVKAMLSHLKKKDTLGIAAVQIGEPFRVFAVKKGEGKNARAIFLVNPEIIGKSGLRFDSFEGCESIGFGKMVYVLPRWKWVKIRALNLEGKPFRIFADASKDVELCAALQHEFDHLNGITIDRKGKFYGLIKK